MRAPKPIEQVGIFMIFFGLGRMLRGWLERRPAGGEIKSGITRVESGNLLSVQDYDPWSPDGVPLPPVRENPWVTVDEINVMSNADDFQRNFLHELRRMGYRRQYGAGNPGSN